MQRVAFLLGLALAPAFGAEFRPPAVPLVTCDPYFSIWSMSDRLNGDATRHWTGAEQPLTSLVRVDGKTYRIMGNAPREVPAMTQRSLEVMPVRTIYEFEGDGIRVKLTFLTPLLPHDLNVLSRPLTYLTWEVHRVDGAPHQVELYFDAAAPIAVNTPTQDVEWGRYDVPGLLVTRMGSQEQAVLRKYGDDLRIDWGYLYAAASRDEHAAADINSGRAARQSFIAHGALPEADDLDSPREARDRTAVLAFRFELGAVGETPVTRHLLLAYDDLFSIEYFRRKLRPYWRRNGAGALDLLEIGERDYAALSAKAKGFDEQLMADLARAGGDKYARLAALAYRQAIAAHKLAADIDGTAIFLPKENFSNGCIGTVDVIYPSSPLFLLMNPHLLEASVTPLMEYASMPRWSFPFAPHDLGTYPLANGQVYGGGEKSEEDQMPVEESGNMILMVAGIAAAEGNAAYAAHYWPLLAKWAGYLKGKGLDPENQLCTDDFAGHLAHNANLSLKAILALGAFGKLAAETGHQEEGAAYTSAARQFAAAWVKMAADDSHYRLAFDKPGTWSQKYNLVWDRLLGLNLFPAEVARREISFYKTKENRYGLPLDNRKDYTKLDWLIWTATLADSRTDFEALADPAYGFADASGSRVPLTDWYDTVTGKQQGFQARSVVGGVFIKMLADPATWRKWAAEN
jgi:Domain of unknown function (DUF4965)/Domain of unknown function (DUF5127)/Domain of unknown function (DUF1793)/Domain of unknown function (DUF4964)